MKINTTTILLLILWPICSFGQVYSFTSSTRVYSALEDPISLNNGVPWVSPDYTIPIGFDFNLFNTFIDTLYFVPDQGGSLLSSSNAEGGVHQLIIPFGAVLIDRGFTTSTSLSPISYQLTGNVPERILKIEWKNCGFFYDLEDDGESVDYIDFQLWLYESDGKIEMHFGPQKITQQHLAYNYETGPQVSIVPAFYVEQDSISTSSLWLKGAATNPSMVASGIPFFMEGNIPVNRVFSFTNLTIGIETYQHTVCRIFPNPFCETLTISTATQYNNIVLQVYDMMGRVVLAENIPVFSNSHQINFPSSLPNGAYIVTINHENKRLWEQVISKQ